MSAGALSKRRFLFIHQNFPGQFVHLAAQLSAEGHDVVALAIEGYPIEGVRFVRYGVTPPAQRVENTMMRDVEAKVARGSACAAAMLKLSEQGFDPDLIVAHPGWGEALFCKDVWPATRLLLFSEFFYNASGSDYGFDPEFHCDSPVLRAQLRLKNTALLHALQSCDRAYSPTHWQRDQLPREYRHKVDVVFDGIDTEQVKPDVDAVFDLPNGRHRWRYGDPVVTFVNRNLEPYRGFHIFMRALPQLLRICPNAHVLIVGRDGVSYGRGPNEGGCWREAMLRELEGRIPIERVHFLGGLPYAHYLRVLQVSACHVYLTYPFVLSWSCVEALSAGCTVVASDIAPVREVIADRRTGLLVPFFDTVTLAGRVSEVLANPRAFQPLGRQARAEMVERYDLRTQCLPRLRKLIDEALLHK